MLSRYVCDLSLVVYHLIFHEFIWLYFSVSQMNGNDIDRNIWNFFTHMK